MVVGETDTLVPVTAPTPGAMLSVSAPVTLQLNVLAPPMVRDAGLALKVLIVGTWVTRARVRKLAPEVTLC